MTLTQQTFLGASIRGFNASIGWNNQPSMCTVDLVEDPANGDSFNPPSIGTAVFFNYSDWQFGGILQSYEKQYSQRGNPVFTVEIQDPRELLSGIQLILQDYTGSTMGLSNIYNIYGYLESLYGFGGSQANDSGIPWYLIRNSFYALQFSLKPIYFRGSYYLFDPFIGLDILPDYYRIGGDSISVLDFIENVCDAVSADFFIEMFPYDDDGDETPAENIIKLRLVNRNYPLGNDKINDFVEQTNGAVAKNAGYELSNDVTTRFVVGGKVNNMYFQGNTTNNPDTPYDDTILPYWGYDSNDNLSIGTGNFTGSTGKEYQFPIDGRPIYLLTGKTSLIDYKTDLAEMRAARVGQDAWESFLWFNNDNDDSIHKGKASILGLTEGKLSPVLMRALRAYKNGGDPPTLTGLTIKDVGKNRMVDTHYANEERRKQVANVYQYIKRFATDYYGKKFMVRVPFVLRATVPESTIVRLSMLPVSTGYVPEEVFSIASQAAYLPYNPEKFTDQENKLYPYASFGSMTDVGSSDIASRFSIDRLSPESYILDQYPNMSKGKMRENLFVKASVDENFVFIKGVPLAVMTLDGPIPDNLDKGRMAYGGLLQEIKDYLLSGDNLEEGDVDDWLKSFGSYAGNDFLWQAKEGVFNIPSMCAVPLESQVLRYGPWYYTNGAGRVEFENDSSLVPWGFGSYTSMNNAGWAKVTSAITSQFVHEKGSVEYPGIPALTLGKSLINAGPIVTDVNVSVSEDGVTTTYRMNTWSWQFGRLGKYNVERFTKFAKMGVKIRKAFRQFYGYPQPLTISRLKGDSETKSNEPTMLLLSGEMITTGEGDDKKVRPNIAGYNANKIDKVFSNDNSNNKAGISLDGLFTPYSTQVGGGSATDMPYFEDTSQLNPFGHDTMSTVFPDGENIDTIGQDATTNVKSLAWRAPIIVCGWGYDLDGNLVPNNDNLRSRADLWKVGPLDIRWDDSSKMWVSSAVDKPWYLGVLKNNIPVADSGIAIRHTFGSLSWSTNGLEDVVWNPHDIILPSGLKVRYTNKYTGWDMLVAEPFMYTECSGAE